MREAYNWTESGLDETDVIYMRYLMMTKEGSVSTRNAAPVATEAAEIGGFYYAVLAMGYFLCYIFIQPFRDLTLAIAFSRMKSQVCAQEELR